ncbi:MAG: glycosyltransferase family 1 protein [Nitrospiraceae bacterium]|nr:MAG: glycosyltransferase family 1 protein [Nitrospiraceae bacterium]
MLTIDVRMIQAAGVGTYIRQLVPRVAAALRAHSITLIGDSDELKIFPWSREHPFRVIDCKAPIYSLREQIELSAKIPKETVLFWSPHYNHPLFYRGRLLITVHDTFHLAMPEFVGGWHRRLYASIMFRAVRKKADGILCVSEFGKEQLLMFCPHGRQLITVIYNGVDRDWRASSAWPSPHPKPYILFVGNVKPHKNLRRLLDAFMLLDKMPCDLVIIGRREGFITGDPELVRHASRLQERVHFLGEIHHEDERLRRYYAGAEVLVLPSLYESFGLPALEAMALGCPVIVSKLGGLPEVCGDAALYINPYDVSDIAAQIERILTDRTLRDCLKQAGVVRAELFDWDRTATSTVEVITDLLGSKAGSC